MSQRELEVRKEALIAEVYAAFEDVTRDGGVSWTEAGAIDDRGDAEERAGARKFDTEKKWTELIDEPKWAPEEQYWGGFSFLDPIGTRYYLPPLLIRALRDGPCDNLFLAIAPGKSDSADSFDWFCDHFSAFTTRQRRCVAAFVRLQVDRRNDPAWKNDPVVQFFEWREAYERYWKQFDT